MVLSRLSPAGGWFLPPTDSHGFRDAPKAMVLTNHVLVGIHTHTQKAVIEASWMLSTKNASDEFLNAC